VLITGESGSGKELVARALHRHSPRANMPFVAINTAAIPRDLLESELFGHERGSFTGAQTQRRGRFEQAEGGTLFLDEIGDMPMELQTRLLRVLSDGHYYRVGGQAPIKANVRVIAATHQALEARVKDGLFREDLLHRLNVIRIRLPSLRERREDIPLLAKHFLSVSAHELHVEPKRLSEATLKYLATLDFPGNVRQLENLCHWLTVMAPAQQVDVTDLPPEFRADTGTAAPGRWEDGLATEVDRLLSAGIPNVHRALNDAFERTLLERALAHTGGRRVEAAHILGIGRNTLTRKLQELGIDRSPALAGKDEGASG
jgi:two-component system, NtrC family, nitrogen regulation response regulator GlnG